MALSKPHLLLIPYPLQGHIIPAVHLALKLATVGFSVTFVNTEAVHHRLLANAGNGDIFAGARSAGLDIRYELVSDGLPVSFDRSLYHDEFMAKVLDEFHGHVEALARRLPALAGLIADTFFVWPATLAGALGIPYVSFWTEPALVFSLYYHMDLLRENGHFGSDENRKDTITYLPGVSAIEPADLTSYLQDSDTSTVVHQIIFKAFDEAHRADFILCNTVQELEPNTIAAIQKKKTLLLRRPPLPLRLRLDPRHQPLGRIGLFPLAERSTARFGPLHIIRKLRAFGESGVRGDRARGDGEPGEFRVGGSTGCGEFGRTGPVAGRV